MSMFTIKVALFYATPPLFWANSLGTLYVDQASLKPKSLPASAPWVMRLVTLILNKIIILAILQLQLRTLPMLGEYSIALKFKDIFISIYKFFLRQGLTVAPVSLKLTLSLRMSLNLWSSASNSQVLEFQACTTTSGWIITVLLSQASCARIIAYTTRMQFPQSFSSSLWLIHSQRVCDLSTTVSQTSRVIAGKQLLQAGPLL